MSAVGDSTTMKIVKGGMALGAAIEVGHVAVVLAEKVAIAAFASNPIAAGSVAVGMGLGFVGAEYHHRTGKCVIL